MISKSGAGTPASKGNRPAPRLRKNGIFCISCIILRKSWRVPAWEMTMQVRILEADFADIGPHWASNREFAQLYNAASICPAYLEPFLVKVMIEARKKLQPGQKKLDEMIRLFNLQEMQHCKQHIAFNKMLFAHYPEIEPMARAYEADYNRFLKTRSLQANLAYCEGFEAMSAIPTTCFFEDFDELWEKFSEWGESHWSGANMKRTDNIKFTSGYEHVTRKMIRACFGKDYFAPDTER